MELKRPATTAITTSEVSPRTARRRRAGACATAALATGATVLVTGAGGDGAPQRFAQAAQPSAAPKVSGTRFETAGEPVRIGVSGADRIEVAARPAHGRVELERDAVRYTPAAGHIGPDTLELSLCRGERCVTPAVSVRTTPEGLSALSGARCRTLVDDDRARRPGARVRVRLPRGLAAAAVSVAVRGAVRGGVVTVAAGGKPVEALRVRAGGATTGNTVLVPVRERDLTVRVGSGGRLAVTLTGSFAPARRARAGRFVRIDPVRVAHLVTVRDGREATVAPSTYGARAGVRAALVLVTAQTGPNPSWVSFRSGGGRVDQTMPWAPVAGGPIERRGVALVRVDRRGRFSFRYDHGAVIDVDVLGYFTGPRARPAVRGLLVPGDPRTLFNGVLGSRRSGIAGPAGASAAFVNLQAEPGVLGPLDAGDAGIASGRVIGSVLDASRRVIALRSQRRLQTRVDLLGYFAAGLSGGRRRAGG